MVSQNLSEEASSSRQFPLSAPSKNGKPPISCYTRNRPFPAVFRWWAMFGLLILALSLWNSIFAVPEVWAAPAVTSIRLKGSPSKPNTEKSVKEPTTVARSYEPAPQGNAPTGKPQTISHSMQMPMKAGSITLHSGQSAIFTSNDGRLQVQIPARAFTAQDLSDAGGSLSVHITQIAPASGSNAGGSGEFSLGTYLLQMVGANGKLFTRGLRAPLTVSYHIQKNEQHLYLDRAYVVLNGTLSVDATTQAGVVQTTSSNTSVHQTFGARQVQRTTINTQAQTLTVTPEISTPSTSMSWDSDSPVASFGSPDSTSTDLSSGALMDSLPIGVPIGPGGLSPELQLSYSSESVNEQHNASAAAGWAGEGWSLSAGEISWDEENVTAGCTSCSATWDSVWSMNDAYGTSSQLIPPDAHTSTYYDDTPNSYCATGGSPGVACPILWHTATESYDKIYAYVGNVNIGEPQNPPCFRVWLPNGIMEEFGCTSDSLQYYYEAGLGPEVTGWYLDLITDPQGNQIHFTYQRDMASWTSSSTGDTYMYPRDVELSTITYDSPNCHNAQAMCIGTNWAPQMEIVFNAGHSPAVRTGNTPSGCNTGTNMRCDDPVDLSANNGFATSLIQNTFVLNTIQVQTRISGTGTWNTLNGYSFSYEQSGPSTSVDPASGINRSTAGMLDLTRFQETGAGGATAILYSGKDNSTSTSYAYMKAFNLSSSSVVVGPNTALSYWVYPQSTAASSGVSGSNSSCVAVDLLFTDGSDLRDSGAGDQYGNQLHPAHQCTQLKADQWNYVTSNIGIVKNGETISQIDIGYDQPANTGGYRGYVDDINISNPTSSTPLFVSDLESNSPQPGWTNTAQGTSNIGGFSGSLAAPELGTRQEQFHTDSAASAAYVFTYTNEMTTYVDSFYKPNPSNSCGPNWNTGNGGGCLLWSESYAGNDRYLSTISNGQGLAQNFTWKIAHNNTHGVPGGGSNNADPFYCDSSQNGYPCDEADDSGWSRAVLLQVNDSTQHVSQNGQGGAITTPAATVETTSYTYLLTYPLIAQECSDCVAGMYWGDQNDADYLSYYNGIFMGFAQTAVNEPTGEVEIHKYFAGEGWGLYDTSQVTCATTTPCHNDPWWDLANAAHGAEYQTLDYDINGTTLLQETDNTYTATCPPSGVSGTPNFDGFSFNGEMISELSKNNAVAVCAIQNTQKQTKVYNGGSGSVNTTTNWTYDGMGRVTKEEITTNGGTPADVVTGTSYVWNAAIMATSTSATGTYIIDTPAYIETDDGAGNRLSCTETSYDGHSYTTGQTGSLTGGLSTSQTNYSDCGTATNSYASTGANTTTTTYNVSGDVVGTTDADANAAISGHTGCQISSVAYTSCTTYDSTYGVFPLVTGNALNQTSSVNYGTATALTGYSTWPASTTDVNGQATSYTYDFLGHLTGVSEPGETSGQQTKQWVYSDWCATTTNAQIPCEEIDEINRQDSSTTVISRAFYDGEGNLVEARTPGYNNQDVVTYALYDKAGREYFKSNPYFVASYTGGPGSAAYSIPDSTQPGVSTSYPNLRTTSVIDPNSYMTTTTDSVICGVAGTSDSGCYKQSMVVDANGHERATLVGGLGKTNYTQTYTGTSSSYALYAATKMSYDAAGDLVSTISPDGTIATLVYNALGREISQHDPDAGTASYTYDPSGNLVASVDARGAAGTVYHGYDGLDRELWRNNTNSATGAWVTYTYDSTASGNNGVGMMTGESFTHGSLSGSYSYIYDVRGQRTSEVETVNRTSYLAQMTYDDNDQLVSATYPTGEVVTASYTTTGWLQGLTTQSGSMTASLASNLAYSGLAGAAGQLTSMNLGSGDAYAFSYDTGERLTSAAATRLSDGTVLYQTQPAYDAANNVIGVQTSLAGSTDTQQFCYDALNRLTWSGTSGIPPCAGTNFNAGTLKDAQYQQSESYNSDSGLLNGPAGGYTYGASSHPHAVTTTSNGYSAAYDTAGNQTCRATSSAATCSGTQTGQQLSYDPEGNLANWQNQPTSPTAAAMYLYDGEGHRVAVQSTVNGTTTTTAYIDDFEEVQTTGSTTQTSTYYFLAGHRIAAKVNGTLYYFGYDALGSQIMVLSATGTIVGSQLYGPYGNNRYSNGLLPTSIGFTGQQSDSVTGLDYYNARYYDPVVGQFLSPDWVQGNEVGAQPYTYVSGNPETLVDPSGHCPFCIALPILTAIGDAIVGVAAAVVASPVLTVVLVAAIVVLGAAIIWSALHQSTTATTKTTTKTTATTKTTTKTTAAITATSVTFSGQVFASSSNIPAPSKQTIKSTKKTLKQISQERAAAGASARSWGRLSNGNKYKCNSVAGSNATACPEFGRQHRGQTEKVAECAEARCMQAALDDYPDGITNPEGYNEFWEVQEDGMGPCKVGDGGCRAGFRRFSELFGPTRVWWIDEYGNVVYQDFVNGRTGPEVSVK